MGGKFLLPHFQVFFKKKTSDSDAGLRIIVTKKIPRAVDRNRIKRVLREFFRKRRPLLPQELVICKINPSAAKVKNAELFQELNKVL